MESTQITMHYCIDKTNLSQAQMNAVQQLVDDATLTDHSKIVNVIVFCADDAKSMCRASALWHESVMADTITAKRQHDTFVASTEVKTKSLTSPIEFIRTRQLLRGFNGGAVIASKTYLVCLRSLSNSKKEAMKTKGGEHANDSKSNCST